MFNKRGMAMEAGSCWFLPRLVGMQQAQEWVMTAELFGADEALKGGLVRSVHAPEELLPAAQALAKKFAASTSSAVAAAVNRRLMWSMWGAQDPLDAVTLDLHCVGYLAAGADAQEGIKSFFEKRAPAFPLKPSKDMPPFGPWAQGVSRWHGLAHSSPSRLPRRGGARVVGGGVMNTTNDAHDPSVGVGRRPPQLRWGGSDWAISESALRRVAARSLEVLHRQGEQQRQQEDLEGRHRIRPAGSCAGSG